MRDQLETYTESFLSEPSFDGRKSMRSLADALKKLRELGGFRGSGDIEFKTMPMQLPNARVSGVVCVIGPRQDNGSRWIIRMPSSAKFSAISTAKVRQTFGIGMLNDAISDLDGNVTLTNGQHVHGVSLIPAPLSYDFDAREHAIVRHALDFLGKKDQCLHTIDNELLPGWKGLDYRKVSEVRIQNRKRLLYYVGEHVGEVSPSFIATTLAAAGMRSSRSRA
jgi:hypothetical protein